MRSLDFWNEIFHQKDDNRLDNLFRNFYRAEFERKGEIPTGTNANAVFNIEIRSRAFRANGFRTSFEW